MTANDEIRFDPATHADVDTIIELVRELNEHDGTPFHERSHREALVGLLGNSLYGRVWIIRDGDQAVGYLALVFSYSLEFGGRDAMIDELYLRKSHRRRGIGRRVVDLAVATCRELGVKAVHLEVERSNLEAQAFYRRAGFADHTRYLMTRWAIPRQGS